MFEQQRYATKEGVPLTTVEGFPSAGIMTYRGTDGLEEMHVFFAMAWFDLGSWAWMHYINEWGTKGIFMVSPLVCSRRRGDEASDVDRRRR